MKAVAVFPGKKDSIHLTKLERPSVDSKPPGLEIRAGYGVVIRILKVGVDATDKEINEAQYGAAPPGCQELVLGHESFGIIEEIGPNVRGLKPGDYVTATVRRPGSSLHDRIGMSDMTSEETYFERGINLLHGFLTEYVVDDALYVVKVPQGLKHLHVLMEPMSIAAKAVEQAFEAQRRMRVWRPERAFVLGAGQIGLLTTLILKLRGLEVYTLARSQAPTRNSEIVEAYGAEYVSLSDTSLVELAGRVGRADLIVEATGNSTVAFNSMEVLGINGVLVWTSITGGDFSTNVQSDAINLKWVLGNKLLMGTVNANREHFEAGIKELALGEMMYPGVTQRILTNPVEGLENYQELIRLLVEEKSALKVFMNVADV
ncbi:MAG: glucose 1-dehydrogenase [Pirellulaceae bacterium]|nr:glucose 1-dehydrogenase [Pirellulaceae bacterium]